jgi:5'-3' exoribonuclease 2
LDIRDGALDFLFNVYKRVLPSLGDYITNHGGQVNLSHVDIILAEVGSIEDHVFAMKHENEEREKQRREEFKARKKQSNGRNLDAPPPVTTQPKSKVMGRAARILEKQKEQAHALKKQGEAKIKSSHMRTKENLHVALALKQSLSGVAVKADPEELSRTSKEEAKEEDFKVKEEELNTVEDTVGEKMQACDESNEPKVEVESGQKRKFKEVDDSDVRSDVGIVGDAKDEFDGDDDDDDEEELEPITIGIAEDVSPEVATAFKDRVKHEQRKKLDEYSRTVEDRVRLHEKGWKDRYYSDKCKADDVANHGGREHLFRSYILGLCWVMKYYYEGCKW